jgi:hypothetical protein
MGNKQSVTHNQRFTIRLVPHIVRTTADSPSISNGVRQDIYQYLQCQIFKQQVQTDLNAFFLNEKDGILQVMVNTIEYYEGWNVLIVKGVIRVMKPTRMSDDLSAAVVKNALYRAMSTGSKTHKYPARQYGTSLGPSKNMIRIRFHKIRTSVKLHAQEKAEEWKGVKH